MSIADKDALFLSRYDLSGDELRKVDRFGGEGTIEIRERNLMLLMEDDPEGFRNRIRELLKTKEETNL